MIVNANTLVEQVISISENSKYLKSVADTLVTKCDEIVIVINNLLTKRQILEQQILQVMLQ